MIDLFATINPALWVFSNLLVAYIAIVLIVFVVGYYALFDPGATTAGKFVFRFAVSLIGVIGLVFISLFVDPRAGREWWVYPGDVLFWRPLVRALAYSYVAFTVTGLVILLGLRKWKPHLLRTAPDRDLVKVRNPKEQTMSNLTPGPDHAAGIDPNVPTDGPGFLARSKKALAGGITGAITGGVTGAISSALTDGTITGAEGWGILGFLVGGFAIGFAGVWAAPKNAE